MERCLLVSLVVFALAPPVAVAQPVEAPIPDTMIAKSPRGTDYLWVSAKAVEAEGFGLLGPRMESFFIDGKARQRQERHGCLPTRPNHVFRVSVRWGRSFVDLVKNSLGIYRGTVVALESGFYGGSGAQPGTMVKLAMEQELKPSPAFDAEGFLYVFLPSVGEFGVRGYRFCPENPDLPPYLPGMGTSVLVFPLLEPEDLARKVVVPEQGECLWENAVGVLKTFPKYWREDPILSRVLDIDEVLAHTVVGLEELRKETPVHE